MYYYLHGQTELRDVDDLQVIAVDQVMSGAGGGLDVFGIKRKRYSFKKELRSRISGLCTTHHPLEGAE